MGTEYSRICFPCIRMMRKVYKKDELLYLSRMQTALFDLTEKLKGNNDQLLRAEYGEFILLDVMARKSNIIKNYFIDKKELSSFFINTKIDCDNIFDFSKVLNKVSIDYPMLTPKTLSLENGKVWFGSLFTKSFKKTIYFYVSMTSDEVINFFATDGEDIAWLPIYSDYNKKAANSIINKDEYPFQMLRMIVNLLFYMSAYPENVLDNPPDERIEDKVDAKQSKTITVSKEISDYLKDTELTPHLRRGHFRLLSSERFVNKKGQVVFVKSSFVKGHAKTVVGEENDN